MLSRSEVICIKIFRCLTRSLRTRLFLHPGSPDPALSSELDAELVRGLEEAATKRWPIRRWSDGSTQISGE